MNKGRLEAFSDGVLAIIITIMVLEIKLPHGNSDFNSLLPVLPVFFSYVLSFIYIGIYWNNHHHLLHGTSKISGSILWANLHLLFWLSLVPVVTAWMGENSFAPNTLALYGVILLMAAVSYTILQHFIIATNGKDSVISNAVGKDVKGKISVVMYVIAIPLSFVIPYISGALYVLVALIWLVPDRRIERTIQNKTAI